MTGATTRRAPSTPKKSVIFLTVNGMEQRTNVDLVLRLRQLRQLPNQQALVVPEVSRIMTVGPTLPKGPSTVTGLALNM